MNRHLAAWIAAPLALIVLLPVILLVLGGGSAAACTPTVPGSPLAPGEFGIGTLNWRGAAHYRRNPHPRESPYQVRMPHMIAAITDSGASIVGFQEFEHPQARAFLAQTGGAWGLVPGHTSTGRPDPRNAIAYLKHRWTPVTTRYVRIRYGPRAPIDIPLAKFTPTRGAGPTGTGATGTGATGTGATGTGAAGSDPAGSGGEGSVWVLNTHNPANAVGGTAALRDAAVRAEAAALNRLDREDPGSAVLFTGDMNDHARFRRLFRASIGPGWTAANPDDHQIDWILGNPAVSFSHTVVDHATKDGAFHYTDHPFVHTVAALRRGAASAPAGGGEPDGIGAAHIPLASRTRLRNTTDGSYLLGRWTLNGAQYRNAATITTLATSRGGSQAAVVAITTALTESGLRSNPGSRGGAYGVFQQTPSQGWGTTAQVLDVGHATGSFLDHLLALANWRSLPVWEAAQAVQRSGAGAASNGAANYTPHVAEAQTIVTALDATTAAGAPPAACPAALSATVPGGQGPFTINTAMSFVGPFDPGQLQARMRAIIAANGHGNPDPFFATQPDGSWYRDCQQFVAVLDGRTHSGYATAATAWQSFLATGAAHPAGDVDGMMPPVGAWLYYGPNHVAVYLGDNRVASTDTWGPGTARVGPASDLTDGAWHLRYLGWATPWG